MGADANRPLAGVKVVESSLLGPGLVTTFLADLGVASVVHQRKLELLFQEFKSVNIFLRFRKYMTSSR